MTLKDCYLALEGNYEDVLGRLYNEDLIKKVVVKFLDDPTFHDLTRAMEAGDLQEAFRLAHNLKGVCLTLAFSKLAASSIRLTEALRGGDLAAGQSFLPEVQKDYQSTIAAIRAFRAEEE